MPDQTDQTRRRGPWDQGAGPGVVPVGEVVSEVLDSGKRRRRSLREFSEDEEKLPGREYRARSPTNSERLNRALAELRPGAFKVHLLLWQWRGAPARGLLPFFTIHSLARFCRLSRPTVRMGLRELMHKGWIRPERYNKHHKNTLFRLVAIRKVPAPE
ncbi:hypothetical protein ES703_107899 [subsurface metagenome]